MESLSGGLELAFFEGGPAAGKEIYVLKGLHEVRFPVFEKGWRWISECRYYRTSEKVDGKIIFKMK